jgi:iron complex transport system substrate-binding protein
MRCYDNNRKVELPQRCARALAAFVALLAICFATSAGRAQSKSVSVTDDVGREVRIVQPVQRIVSLAPSVTETIYALGAQDRLVGDTNYCDFPPEAKQKTHVGSVMAPNLEEIVALKPDVVIASKAGNRIETVRALESLHIPVYGTYARTVSEVLQSMLRMGGVIGAGDEASKLVANLQTRLDDLRRRLENAPRVRVLFVVWREPLISMGQQTFLADAIRVAGGESVVNSDQDWPHVSMEEMVKLQPDYVVMSADDREHGEADLAAISNSAGWRDLKAIRDKHVAIVDDAISYPAPRLIDAIEQLGRQLHPEAFATAQKLPLEVSVAR